MDIEKPNALSVIYIPLIIFAMTAATFAVGYYIKTSYLSVFDIPYEHYTYNLREIVTGGYIVISYTIVFASIIYLVHFKSRQYQEERKATFRAAVYAVCFMGILSLVLFLPLDQKTYDTMTTWSSFASLITTLITAILIQRISSTSKKSTWFDKLLNKINSFIVATHNTLDVVFVFSVVLITLPVIATAIGQSSADNKTDFYEVQSTQSDSSKHDLVIYEGSDRILLKKYDEKIKKFEKGYRVLKQEDITLLPFSKHVDIKNALSQ